MHIKLNSTWEDEKDNSQYGVGIKNNFLVLFSIVLLSRDYLR
jgi:hypothetical protein